MTAAKTLKTIIATLLITTAFASMVHSAVGIPDYLQPKNAGLKSVSQEITKVVDDKGQQGAVEGANILLQYIANILLFFAAPLAVLFLTRAGFDYAMALGEESALEKAKRELMWATLGLLVVMFAYVFVRAFLQLAPTAQIINDATFGPGQGAQTEAPPSQGSPPQAASPK